MDVIYLTGERVQQLHVLALEVGEGGLDGVRSEHALYSSLAQVEQGFGAQDAFPTIAEKAAAYGYYLTQNHPFLDGNKRTAALALEVFLDLNGYEFHQSDDEVADVFVSLAAGEIDVAEFFGWVMNHAKLRQPAHAKRNYE
jgi:death on curing protein